VSADQLSGRRTLAIRCDASTRADRVSCLRTEAWVFGGSDIHDQTAGDLRDLFRVLPHGPRERDLELTPRSWRITRARLERAARDRERARGRSRFRAATTDRDARGHGDLEVGYGAMPAFPLARCATVRAGDP
jgi:hypothetical protein